MKILLYGNSRSMVHRLVLTADDGNYNELIREEISFTDFPLHYHLKGLASTGAVIFFYFPVNIKGQVILC